MQSAKIMFAAMENTQYVMILKLVIITVIIIVIADIAIMPIADKKFSRGGNVSF